MGAAHPVEGIIYTFRRPFFSHQIIIPCFILDVGRDIEKREAE